MRRNAVAVVGAAETTELGVIPNMSQIQLHADAALNAIADAGLKLSDIDGIATAVETPQQIAHYLGIKPTWVDGTSVGGCSFMLHVRHAAAAIEAGLCKTVLITHAESGKSMIGKLPRSTPPDSLNGQFESPFGVYGPPSMFPIPVLRYMKTHGITHEQIAMVAVVQREWAAKNPRAMMKAPITVEDVLNSKMIAYPFRILQCCLVTDGGGALILHLRRPRQGLSEQAGLYPRHRRERGNADGQPDGDVRQFARLPHRGSPRFQGGRHRAQGRRPPHDLRRVRASAALRPRRSRLHAT